MAMLILDCARCAERKMTHDVMSCSEYLEQRQKHFEYFVRCRACGKTSTWEVAQVAGQHPPPNQAASKNIVNEGVSVVGLIRPRGTAIAAPEYTPADLKLIFDEGANCITIGAWNASSAMFRKIVDQISKDRMNAAPGGPPADKRTRFNLKPRLQWLFQNGHLPKEVEALATLSEKMEMTAFTMLPWERRKRSMYKISLLNFSRPYTHCRGD